MHDEILVNCPADLATVKHVSRIMVREMTRAFVDLFPFAPTRGLATPSAGPSWGQEYKIWREDGDTDEKEPRYWQYLKGMRRKR